MIIFILTTRYPNNLNPQASVFVHEQCKELAQRGHNVFVLDPCIITLGQWKKQLEKGVHEREWDGIKVFSYPTLGIATTLLFSNQHNYIRHAKKLYDYAVERVGESDIIYAHFSMNAGVAACRIGLKKSVPVVVIEHGGAVMNPGKSVFYKSVLRTVNRDAKRIICVSTAQKNSVKRYIENDAKIIVIPNMVSRKFSYKPHNKGNPFVFFSAGNLYRVKRMDLLINAFADVFSQDNSTILRIAGDGVEKEGLKSLIRSRNLNSKVFMLGRLNQEEIIKEYEKCDAFALASEHESFGIAYREAMSIGRPVIATKNGGVSEDWFDGAGYLVDIGDQEQFASAMRKMVEEYDDFCMENISMRVRSTTDPDVVINKIECVLQQSIDEHAKV